MPAPRRGRHAGALGALIALTVVGDLVAGQRSPTRPSVIRTAATRPDRAGAPPADPHRRQERGPLVKLLRGVLRVMCVTGVLLFAVLLFWAAPNGARPVALAAVAGSCLVTAAVAATFLWAERRATSAARDGVDAVIRVRARAVIFLATWAVAAMYLGLELFFGSPQPSELPDTLASALASGVTVGAILLVGGAVEEAISNRRAGGQQNKPT